MLCLHMNADKQDGPPWYKVASWALQGYFAGCLKIALSLVFGIILAAILNRQFSRSTF